MLGTRRASFQRRICIFFYLYSRDPNTIPERAKLVVARAMLAHIFEQWKERLGTLEPENIPPDRASVCVNDFGQLF